MLHCQHQSYLYHTKKSAKHMSGFFSFECSCCGKQHEGSPSFGFKSPSPWLGQPDEIKQQGKLSGDLCYYTDEDGTHYFARAVIEIPIHDISDPFLWGVWTSLSKESYEHYIDTCDAPDLDRTYFGWFCNKLPYYASTLSLATDVHPQAGGTRPYLCLHATEHELYHDQINGISLEKAQKIAEIAMHG